MKRGFLNDAEAALAVIDGAIEGIIVAEIASQRVKFANRAACSMFGYTHERMLELSVPDIHPPEHLQSAMSSFDMQARGEMDLARAIPCKRRDGATFWADIGASRTTVDGAECIVEFFTDATRRVTAETDLGAAQKEWKVIFDAVPHPTIIMDHTHTILSANKRLTALLNRDSSEILGMKCWEVFHGPGAKGPPPGCPYEKMLRSSSIESTDMEIEAFGGWAIVSCTPILSEDGALEKVIHIATDITDRKRMEQKLEASAGRYRDLSNTLETIFDSIPDILGVQDLDHGIIRYNKAGYEYLGKRPENVYGRKCFELIGRDRPCDRCATSEVYETRRPARIERYFDEIERWMEIRAYPVLDGGGKLVRIIEHLRDITELKKAEANRIAYEQKLQQTQKLESLGILAGGIAHDFNNLLGGIYGFLDMARAKSTDTEVNEYLDAMLTTMSRARNLTQQLLTFAKGGSPNRKTASLTAFVRDVARFALSGSNVSCEFTIDDDLWPCDYDADQMGQVIDNIVINAVQAMPAGGCLTVTATNLSLEAGEHHVLPSGAYVCISFTDSGVGIPKEIVDRLFDPFFTTKQKGSGLGLATSYSIVRKHDGCIDVESEPGTGSTFRIYLPASRSAVATEKREQAIRQDRTGLIIVMDDEEAMRESIGDMLELDGHTVRLTEDGEEAVRVLDECRGRHTPVLAILLDLTVPGGMGGKAALEAIRRRDTAVPVFVASGYADDPIIQNPREYGFTDSIRKPFLLKDLRALLARNIG